MRSALPLLALLAGCPHDSPTPPSPLTQVAETDRVTIEGVTGPAYIIYDAYGTPYIYADDAYDAAAVHGYVCAKDRFLQMDLTRRLAQGTLSELVGQDGLANDIESVQYGTREVTAKILAAMTDAQTAEFMAYARGVNTYIQAVQDGDLAAPSEYEAMAPLLGYADAGAMLEPFTLSDVASIVTTFVYQTGFSNREIGWSRAVSQIDTLFTGVALEDLRTAGAWDDVWGRVSTTHRSVSAADFTPGGRRSTPVARRPVIPHVPDELLASAESRELRWADRLGHDLDMGWGSNAWAMSGTSTETGAALLAGDGHLDLSSPSIVWSVGIDTQTLSPDGSGYHVYGVTSPGMPSVAAGTNGHVAWSSTQPFADINDQYREVLQLDASGAPTASMFQGEWHDLIAQDSDFVVADVSFLDSVGRTETWRHWSTFDGRRLMEIEGTPVASDYVPADGETVVNLAGRHIVPGDTDGDGDIVALSFDFTGLDDRSFLGFFPVRDAHTVEDFADLLTHTAAVSQNFIVADETGSSMYTQFQAMPCRGYLARSADGGFADGANPRYLLDGTLYGGFTVPFDDDGRLAFGDADPYRCVIAPEDYPHTIDPAQGYVFTSNNDPAGYSLDEDLENDPIYIGGPWEDDYRAHRIDQVLAGHAADQSGSIAAMAALQADHQSALGVQFTPVLLDTLTRVADWSATDAPLAPAQQRAVDVYDANAARFEEVQTRLTAWGHAGYDTPSGVDTDYDPLQPGDEVNAVATMIFNTWLPREMDLAFGDERLWGLMGTITGATGRTRLLTNMVDGRGADNPLGLSSFNPETQESAFWDRLGTDVIETSDEITVQALAEALDRLAGPPLAGDRGGFGTDDMTQWIWGYRHWAHFPSLLGSALGDGLGSLTGQFEMSTDAVPVAEGVPPTDPRANLAGWPRHGDALAVDNGNPGWSAQTYSYDAGPVFRLVVQLDGDGQVTAQNVLPGGSSAVKDDPHWVDQVPLWLANEAIPVLWTVDDVIANGVGRTTVVGGGEGRPLWQE